MDPHHTHSNSHSQYYQYPTGTPYQRADSEGGDHPTATSLQAHAVGGAYYHLVSPSHSRSQYLTYSQSHPAHYQAGPQLFSTMAPSVGPSWAATANTYHVHSHIHGSARIHQVVGPFSQQPPRNHPAPPQPGHPQQYPSASSSHPVVHLSQSPPKKSHGGAHKETSTQRLKNLLQRTGCTKFHRYETWIKVERGIDGHYAQLLYDGKVIAITPTGHGTKGEAKEEAARLAYSTLFRKLRRGGKAGSC